MKKKQPTFEYRLERATTFQDNKGREVTLPPNTRLVYEGYNAEGLGAFSVTAGKEIGRRVQAESLDPESFRGGAADVCRSCGEPFGTGREHSIMVPDLCATCEDAGEL